MKRFGSNLFRSNGTSINIKIVTRIAVILSAFMLAVSAYLAVKYSAQPLLGLHGFRQTQTALTSYWICQTGFKLAYWTPVGGYPWPIPFEFPIYQLIVSLIACPLGLDIATIGRFVSYVFWIACLAPVFQICRRLFGAYSRLYFFTFAALFLSTPIYLFWGRSFLIETASLFFILYFIAFSLDLTFGKGRWIDAALAGTFLALAMLQKSTTALPLLPLLTSTYLIRKWPGLRNPQTRAASLYRGITAYVVPFLIGFAWIKYSDHVKSANALGKFLTSDALFTWNFGTLEQRFGTDLWLKVIWHRGIGENIAGHLGALIIIAGFIVARTQRTLILLGVVLFLTFFMVFTNLFYLHEYYPVANTIYLIFALAVSIAGITEARPTFSLLSATCLAAVIVINLYGYFSGYLFADERRTYDDTHPVLTVTKFIREHTDPAGRLLIYGESWNSEMPYYAQRRAFVVPDWFSPNLAPLENPMKYLNDIPSAILVCNDARRDPGLTSALSENYPTWPLASFETCNLYLRKI